jgi:dephospho-CoA kinase
VILIGLTGGIGAGKSTVSTMLARRGAVIIDGDVIVRELQRPGTAVLAKIIERFGGQVITESGELNRGALAAIVFPDPIALADLNRIVHPPLAVEITRRVEIESHTDHIVVLDLPLLSENPRQDLSGVVVVDVEPLVARDRLIKFRGMSESDVNARMSRQVSRKTRNQIAGFIINNSSSLEHLQNEVDRAWNWIVALPQSPKSSDREVMP